MHSISLHNDGQATMTSQQIAELVEKRHDNVKRTIEGLTKQGVIESPQIEEVPTATRPASVYVFSGERGKRDSIIVVARLSPEFTARLVDRWQELERRLAEQAALAAFDIPQTLPEALRLAAQAMDERDRLAQVNHAQALALTAVAPKIEALDRIAQSDGSMCLTDAAKTLQVRPRQFNQFLQANSWVYRRPMGAGWVAYQDRIQRGHLEHKVTSGFKPDDTEWVSTQVRVTPKGLAKLAEMLGKHHLLQQAIA